MANLPPPLVPLAGDPQPNLQTFAAHLHSAAEKIHGLGNHIQGAAAQAALMQNMPVIAQGEAITNMFQQIQVQLQSLQAGIHQNGVDIQGLRAELHQARADIQGLQAGLQQNGADIQGLQAGVQQTQAVLENFQAEFRTEQGLLAVRLFNSGVHRSEEIRYPSHFGGDLPATLPRTLGQLWSYTAAQCEAARTTLGLPEFPPGTPVAQKREKIADYLGLCLPAH